MKLLQIMAGSEFGGAEEFFVRLVIALNKTNIEQRVIIRKNKKREKRLIDVEIRPQQYLFGNTFDFSTRWHIGEQIKKFEPDIILTWMNRATKMTPPTDNCIHVGRLGGYYNTKYYSNCDHLIANTKGICNYLMDSGVDRQKVHYLPNFVSEKNTDPIDRKEFYTPEGVPLILAIGRLHENKGFDILFKAVARLPNTYLWIAGEGPVRGELEALAERIGIKPRIRFLGWRDDIESIYGAANIFVCSSRHEPLGNVIIEAWAQGLPVLATESAGPRELITDSYNGILVPVDDSRALANALTHLIADKEFRGVLAEGGKTEYKKHFTEKIVLEKYMAFFESILE